VLFEKHRAKVECDIAAPGPISMSTLPKDMQLSGCSSAKHSGIEVDA